MSRTRYFDLFIIALMVIMLLQVVDFAKGYLTIPNAHADLYSNTPQHVARTLDKIANSLDSIDRTMKKGCK